MTNELTYLLGNVTCGQWLEDKRKKNQNYNAYLKWNNDFHKVLRVIKNIAQDEYSPYSVMCESLDIVVEIEHDDKLYILA